MAGAKGRSGGYRPGAGRKPRADSDRSPSDSGDKEPEIVSTDDPLEFLKMVMMGQIDPSPKQLRAAIAAAQYVHVKAGDGGKKEKVASAAEKAATGRFAPKKAPPRLAAANGKPV